MANIKTVPNQKVVKIQKEKCDKQHIYTTINLEAMNKAAVDLEAGAFKLWCYFAKNQDRYEFALSSKEVAESFGIKTRQYNTAVAELIDKGYLVNTGGNYYTFNEIPVITKCNNDAYKNDVITKCNNAVITKCNNDVITKCNNALLQNVIRNTTDNTLHNTNDNTEVVVANATPTESQKESKKEERDYWSISEAEKIVRDNELKKQFVF